MREIDSELLISLVFEKPAIWDKRLKEHSNRNYIEKCWQDVSKIMKVEENKIRKKWKYLRDQFAFELSKLSRPKSGDEGGGVANVKWPYFKMLYFLKDIVPCRASSGNMRKSCKGDVDDLQVNLTYPVEKIELQIVDDPLTDECKETALNNKVAEKRDYLTAYGSQVEDDVLTTKTSNLSSAVPHEREYLNAKIKRFRSNDYTTALLKIENQKLQLLREKSKRKNLNAPQADEHLHFFKSLIPHVQIIPKVDLLDFRNEIQNVVKRFAYPDRVPFKDSPSSVSASYSQSGPTIIGSSVYEEYPEPESPTYLPSS